MRKSLAIVLAAAALMFGATVSLMSGAAVAHHNTQHSLAQCGSVTCMGTQTTQVPSTTVRGR